MKKYNVIFSDLDGTLINSLLKLEQICSLSISCFNLSLLFSLFQVHP